jgi:hypothetical protein
MAGRADGGDTTTAPPARVRRAQATRRQHRRMIVAAGVVVLIVVLVAVLVAGGSGSRPHTVSASSSSTDPLARVAAIPVAHLATELRTLGPQLGTPLTPITGPALTSGGKPEVLFIGAEYCPYCAAERWALVTALSQFGTFTGLAPLQSSSTDIYPDTPTVSFRTSRFVSPYVSFVGVETETREQRPLQVPTAAQSQLWVRYANQAIPFVDFAGKFVLEGATYSPQLFAGLTTDQASGAVADSTTQVGQAVQTVAGYFVAKLCVITGERPTSVCSAFAPE